MAMTKLHLYQEIGRNPWTGEGFASADMADFLAKLPPKEPIEMFVDSPGGAAFDGIAIYNQLVRHRGPVTATIDGLAASAASLVVMAAETVTMSSGSFLMLHNPWGFVVGDARDMRATADQLDGIRKSYLDVYSQRSGRNADEIAGLMDAETWLDAEEAVLAGFAEMTDDARKVAAFACVAPFGYRAVPDEIAKAPVRARSASNRHLQNLAIVKTRLAAMRRT